MEYVDRFLRDQGFYEACRSDWERVLRANRELDPTRRERRITAEDLVERSTVVDVRADASRLHATLERLRFFPSAYMPGLLAATDGRQDIVQYTRLTG